MMPVEEAQPMLQIIQVCFLLNLRTIPFHCNFYGNIFGFTDNVLL